MILKFILRIIDNFNSKLHLADFLYVIIDKVFNDVNLLCMVSSISITYFLLKSYLKNNLALLIVHTSTSLISGFYFISKIIVFFIANFRFILLSNFFNIIYINLLVYINLSLFKYTKNYLIKRRNNSKIYNSCQTYKLLFDSIHKYNIKSSFHGSDNTGTNSNNNNRDDNYNGNNISNSGENTNKIDELGNAITKNPFYYINSNICSICYETFARNDKIIKLSCNHIYHSNCILSWVETIFNSSQSSSSSNGHYFSGASSSTSHYTCPYCLHDFTVNAYASPDSPALKLSDLSESDVYL
ncbi:uncharacterized protein ASCRUDRAFT_150503 [Ascoidea rubescens DSM 1968]|uniref:RING-type domain-containing protein n=1 Tax=Ascoidea rubescens DSM 1968 TaxID=1344418 RepID=A0A1D2VGL4_9ASCO|nr:hypothetical protein ASCRUDRAFT_150503 [Ascoidea rubescens DSM 1968]ODV60811.1 hypothetical protein ASCRUDRAFT_150503 [Ascoidea rubescens DSM 1968]